MVAVRRIRRNGRKLRPVFERTSDVILNNDNLVYFAGIDLAREVAVSDGDRSCLLFVRRIVDNCSNNSDHECIKNNRT